MKKIIKIVLSLILFLFVSSQIVHADDDDRDIGFYISPVIPSTQLDFSRSFLYPQTVPGEEQTLKVRVVNTTDEPKTIKIAINDAVSTEQGTVDYDIPKVKEESLVNPISEILTVKEDEIELKGKEKRTVEFKLTPPDKHYEGIKMGSIDFIHKTGETIQEFVDVNNSYRIGVVASESEEDFRNGSELEIADVQPGLNRGRKSVDVHLRNPQPKLIQNLYIDAVIINRKTNEEVMRRKVENYSLAPNSILPFVFDWGLSSILPGDYQVKMDIANGEHEFKLEKNFTITSSEAKKINDDSPFRINTPLWIKVLSVVMGVLAVAITTVIFMRQKKWKKQMKHRRRGRRKSKGKGR